MKLEHSVVGNTLYLRPQGEMDHHSAVNARAEADALIERYRPATLYLDLSRINFCDSSGLGFILGRYRKTTAFGGRTVILNPSSQAERILRLAGMDKYLKTEIRV